MCTMGEAEGDMNLTKGYDANTVIIQRLECTEAVRTIGVSICHLDNSKHNIDTDSNKRGIFPRNSEARECQGR